MNEIVVVGIAGFAAALVDGSLGMGFGPTSSSILLSSGISPVGVSATVNIAKVVTGLAGGVSHWRFGNVDWRLVRRLAIPGAFGALIGAVVLANVDGDRLRPMLAALLAVIGVRILVRFRQPIAVPALPAGSECPTPGVEIAGAVGGLTNGMIGAWGPVVTPYLLHRRIAPRIVVGSVNTAEIAVAFVAAGSLITSSAGVDPAIVLSMLAGGVIAAPLAAWTVGRVPARQLGVLVGGLLLLTNARELCSYAGAGAQCWFAYGAILAAVGWAWTWPRFHSDAPCGDHDVLVDDTVETVSVATRRRARRPFSADHRAGAPATGRRG